MQLIPCNLTLATIYCMEAVVVLRLSSWLTEQEVRDSIPGLATTISEIGYLLLPSRDMAEIPLKRRISSKQSTKFVVLNSFNNTWYEMEIHLGSESRLNF